MSCPPDPFAGRPPVSGQQLIAGVGRPGCRGLVARLYQDPGGRPWAKYRSGGIAQRPDRATSRTVGGARGKVSVGSWPPQLKGLIEREGSNAYRGTSHGLSIGAFSAQLATRAIIPLLTDLTDLARPSTPAPRPLAIAWRTFERELDLLVRTPRLARLMQDLPHMFRIRRASEASGWTNRLGLSRMVLPLKCDECRIDHSFGLSHSRPASRQPEKSSVWRPGA
jgi:hypothetical protein